ncbi:caspase-3-like [Argonauta hians]
MEYIFPSNQTNGKPTIFTDSVPVPVHMNGKPTIFTDSVPVHMNALKEREYECTPDFSYKMDHRERGFALIINNELSSTDIDEEISKRDVLSLNETLKHLGFKIVNRKNLSVVDIKQIFTDISTMDHSNFDCFICFILTVGSHPTTIQCLDGTKELSDLLSVFLPNKCPTLIEKPKLFFIQTTSPFVSSTNSTPFEINDKHQVPMVFLSEDFLVSTCTTRTNRRYNPNPVHMNGRPTIFTDSAPDHMNHIQYTTRTNRGYSVYIETLCKNLQQYGDEMDLLRILTHVNNEIVIENKRGLRQFTQVPFLNSTLTKQLIFKSLLRRRKKCRRFEKQEGMNGIFPVKHTPEVKLKYGVMETGCGS